MSNPSRHMACSSCREKKARCDGNVPSCERCRRAGDICLYAPTQKLSRVDLLGTVENLQERLLKAEAVINDNQSKAADQNQPPSATAATDLSTSAMDLSDFQIPGHVGLDGSLFTLTHGYNPHPSRTASAPYPQQQSWEQRPSSVNTDMLNYPPSPPRVSGNNVRSRASACLAADDVPSGNGGPVAAQPSLTRQNSLIPSLQEIRAAKSTHDPSSYSTPSTGRKCDGADSSVIAAGLTTFASSVFKTHSEVVGLASVIVEYIVWLRETSKSRAITEATYGSVLETLEARLKEMSEISEAQNWESWRHLRSDLDSVDGMPAHLTELEDGLQRRAAQAAHFFQDVYDISHDLTDQRPALQGSDR